MNYENLSSDDAKQRQLELLLYSLTLPVHPGYPDFNQRLFRDITYMEYSPDGRLFVPDGPWTINEHPNRPDKETAPDVATQFELQVKGYELDSAGRPLHPWLTEMISDPAIGVVNGKGAYWKWGPNYTADPIVVSAGNLLLIKRGDSGRWALPGGFIDHGESGEQAARREACEETGIIIPSNVVPQTVYQGPVVDARVTANAWPVTTAVLYMADSSLARQLPAGQDDAVEAKWEPIENVLNGDALFGSHRYLIELAFNR